MPRQFWVFLAAMLAAWLAMNMGTAPRIEALSGGLRLLDMRLTGYSFADARDFLAAIGPDGRALYLGPQFWLDMVFPPLLAAVLFMSYRALFSGLTGLIIAGLSLTSVVVDYLENFAIASLLRAGPDALTPEMVATANQWTTLKWGLALLGLVTLVIGIALRLRQRFLVNGKGMPHAS